MDKERMQARNDTIISYHSVSEEDMMYWGHVFNVEVSDMKVSTLDGDGREYVVLSVKLPGDVKVIFYGKRTDGKLTDALANMVNSHMVSKAARENGLVKTIEQNNEENRLVALGVKP